MPDTVMTTDAAPLYRNRSNETAKLAAALAAATKAFAPIPKDREVTVKGDFGQYKFKYATMDAIRSATMPALAEQGLCLVQGMVDRNNGYAIETTLYHASGEWLSNITPMFVSGRVKDGKTYPPTNQELGSAQSYARRYGMSALLCITADEDDDGNTADGNHIAGSERVPFKPGPAGSAGGGTQFRPDRRGTTSNWVGDAERDGIVDNTRAKGTLPAKPGAKPANGKITPEQRATKIKDATDKRIKVLKDGTPWTRAGLSDLWSEDAEWIDWMSDPTNEVLNEYERFTNAFAEAELTIKETA